MEDCGAEGDLNCGGLAQDISHENNLNMLPRDCSCEILVKNVAAFCFRLKSLPEAKVEFWINCIGGEIPKQPSTDCCVVTTGHSYTDLY